MKTQPPIKEIVERILQQNHLTKPPIPLPKIAARFGVNLASSELDNSISGFLYREKNQSVVIAVNDSHPQTRQRFSIAHELGHFILNHQGTFFINRGAINFRNSLSSSGEDKLEREANAFAAELLMPEIFLKKDIKNATISLGELERLEELADKYQVSVGAMTFRLTNLGFLI